MRCPVQLIAEEINKNCVGNATGVVICHGDVTLNQQLNEYFEKDKIELAGWFSNLPLI